MQRNIAQQTVLPHGTVLQSDIGENRAACDGAFVIDVCIDFDRLRTGKAQNIASGLVHRAEVQKVGRFNGADVQRAVVQMRPKDAAHRRMGRRIGFAEVSVSVNVFAEKRYNIVVKVELCAAAVGNVCGAGFQLAYRVIVQKNHARIDIDRVCVTDRAQLRLALFVQIIGQLSRAVPEHHAVAGACLHVGTHAKADIAACGNAALPKHHANITAADEHARSNLRSEETALR